MSLGWDEKINYLLGKCGDQVFIGHHVLINDPFGVYLGNRVRIDPFTLITSRLMTDDNIQICSHAVLGGSSQTIRLGNWTFIGYGSQLFTGSEDYSGDFGPVNDFWGHNMVHHADIVFNDYSGVASQVIVMPGVELPEGCLIGAQSFVYSSKHLEEWAVYVGNPLRRLKYRNSDSVIARANSKIFLKQR